MLFVYLTNFKLHDLVSFHIVAVFLFIFAYTLLCLCSCVCSSLSASLSHLLAFVSVRLPVCVSVFHVLCAFHYLVFACNGEQIPGMAGREKQRTSPCLCAWTCECMAAGERIGLCHLEFRLTNPCHSSPTPATFSSSSFLPFLPIRSLLPPTALSFTIPSPFSSLLPSFSLLFPSSSPFSYRCSLLSHSFILFSSPSFPFSSFSLLLPLFRFYHLSLIFAPFRTL